MSAQPTPPKDLPAERAAIGAALIDPGCCRELLEILDPGDFYDHRHTLIWEALLAVLKQGHSPDTIGIRAQLGKQLDAAGGDDYLLQLVDVRPTLESASRYAKRIRQLAHVRAIAQRAAEVYSSSQEQIENLDEWIDAAEDQLADLPQRPGASQSVEFADVIAATWDALEKQAERGDEMIGVRTGLRRLDSHLRGLSPGHLVVCAGRPGMGKAQPLDAKVLTPHGFKKMGDLTVGCCVIGANGRPTTVTKIEDRGELPIYRVRFSDGAETLCSDDHLWSTRTRSERRRGLPASVRQLREIRGTLERCDGGINHSVQYASPAELACDAHKPIHPWLLGAYLGDGDSGSASVRFTNPEPDVRRRFIELLHPEDAAVEVSDLLLRVKRKKRSNQVSETFSALRTLGVAGLHSYERFIPEIYLHANIGDRYDLLRGLFDTDGYVDPASGTAVEYSTASEQLAKDITFLAGSLGARVTSSTGPAHYVANGVRVEARDKHRLFISFPRGGTIPVSSEKHLSKWSSRQLRMTERFLKSVSEAGSDTCRCIQVSASDGLYVTDDFIVTHNSALGGGAAQSCREQAIVFSLEMMREQWGRRAISSVARVDGHLIRGARGLASDDWRRMTQAAQDLQSLPIKFWDKPGTTVEEIVRECRRVDRELKRGGDPDGLKLVVIDYLQLVRVRGDGDKRRFRSREEEVAHISKTLKDLAKELRVCVLALAQLNRALEARPNKRPIMSDLRESGAVEQDSDVILFIYRDEVYNPFRPNTDMKDNRGMAEVIIAKNREGSVGTITCAWVAPFTTFRDAEEQRTEADAPGTWHDDVD